MAVSTTARASQIVYEGFNYAGQSDNAALGAAAFNSGTGLSRNWQGVGKYRTSGLTISDFAVTGGCAQNSNAEIYYRPLSVSKTGTISPATTQIVEYGSDLTGRTPVVIPTTSAGIVIITPGSPSDHVNVTLPVGGNQTFARLKVSKP